MSATSPFNSGGMSLASSAIADLERLLTTVAPAFGQIIANALTNPRSPINFLQGATYAQANIAGMGMAFGSSALFGAQPTDLQFLHATYQNYTNAMMGDARTAYTLQKNAAVTAMSQNLFGGGPPGQLTSAMLGFAYDQRVQMPYLQGNMEAGARYMGAAPEYMGGNAGVNTLLQQQSAALMNHFANQNNAKLYYGYGGREVGQLYAEMARTGAITPQTNANDVIAGVQNAAGLARSAQRLFGGSMMDAIDQVRAITGMDILAAPGNIGKKMLTDVTATGMITSHTGAQMNTLSMMAAQTMAGRGQDTWGAMTAGSAAASMLMATRGIAGNEFINEPRLRQTIVNMAAEGQSGDIARQISGAYAMIATRRGADVAKKFEADLAAIGPGGLRPDTVATTASRVLGASIDAASLLEASYTTDAERARMQGVGMGTAIDARLQQTEVVRQYQLDQIVGTGRAANIMKELGDAGITVAGLERLQGPNKMSAVEIGRFIQVADMSAKARGMGSAREVDKLIGYNHDRTQRARIQTMRERAGGTLDALRYHGVLGGIDNLVDALQSPEAGVRGLTLSLLTGGTDVDISSVPALDKALAPYSAIAAEAKGLITGGNIEEKKAGWGINAAAEALFTGRIGGREAGGGQIEKARNIFKETDKKTRNELAQEFLTEAGGDFAELSLKLDIDTAIAAAADAGPVSEDRKQQITESKRAIQMLDRYVGKGGEKLKSTLRAADKTQIGEFGNEMRNALMSNKTMEEAQNKAATASGMSKEEFGARMEAEAGMRGEGGLDSILRFLPLILDAIKNK